MDTALVTVVVLFGRAEMDTSSQTAGHLLRTRHTTIVSEDIKEADNNKKTLGKAEKTDQRHEIKAPARQM
jgi:hypothetical protein